LSSTGLYLLPDDLGVVWWYDVAHTVWRHDQDDVTRAVYDLSPSSSSTTTTTTTTTTTAKYAALRDGLPFSYPSSCPLDQFFSFFYRINNPTGIFPPFLSLLEKEVEEWVVSSKSSSSNSGGGSSSHKLGDRLVMLYEAFCKTVVVVGGRGGREKGLVLPVPTLGGTSAEIVVGGGGGEEERSSLAMVDTDGGAPGEYEEWYYVVVVVARTSSSTSSGHRYNVHSISPLLLLPCQPPPSSAKPSLPVASIHWSVP